MSVIGDVTTTDDTAGALSGDDTWTWPEAIEDDSAEAPSSRTAFRSSADSLDDFWSGGFLPPPPRPPYLEDRISTDGLTTCDLCSWALERYSETKPQSSEIGFAFSHNLFITLTIVSILSALLGAVIMIVLLNCRSRFGQAGSHRTFFCLGRRRYASSGDNVPNNSVVNLQNYKEVEENHRPPNATSKTKSSWLMLNKTRRAAPTQLLTTSVKSIPIGNHYTVEETYTSVNEAVYTELDRIPSPAYQNNGYMLEIDHERNSSAPSSAYYSDISAHGAYEIVGQTPISNCVNLRSLRRISNVRYSSTDENVSVNSNYI